MRCLVTGGAGFIGSHLADRLWARGADVVVLDDLSSGDPRNLSHLAERPRFEFVRGSVLDADLVTKLVSDADAVVHLAAAVGVRLILERPLESLITNIGGTETVLAAAAERGARTLIMSSSEVYGKNENIPLREDDDRLLGSPSVPRWSYAASKVAGEALAHAYHRQRTLPVTVIRLFNTVGPRQTSRYGMVLPRFVAQAVAGDDLTVYGDGTQTRCFCHVLDVVDALIVMLDHEGAVGETFNVGSDREVPIRTLAEMVVAAAGSRSRIRHVPYDEAYGAGFEEMHRRVPDIRKVRSRFDWQPCIELEEMIARLIAGARSAPSST